jgi:hypothetical protein
MDHQLSAALLSFAGGGEKRGGPVDNCHLQQQRVPYKMVHVVMAEFVANLGTCVVGTMGPPAPAPLATTDTTGTTGTSISDGAATMTDSHSKSGPAHCSSWQELRRPRVAQRHARMRRSH